MPSLDTEFQFYKKNKPDLLDKYEDKYVVIVGESVIGSYDSYQEAVTITAKTHKLGTFFVQLVTAEDEVAILSRVVP